MIDNNNNIYNNNLYSVLSAIKWWVDCQLIYALQLSIIELRNPNIAFESSLSCGQKNPYSLKHSSFEHPQGYYQCYHRKKWFKD